MVLTSADARTSLRTSVQTLGKGEGSPKATRPGEENVIFSWREIARFFWATSAAKRLFDSVGVLNLRKKHQISINGNENLPLRTSSLLSVLLRTRSAQRLSSQHFAAVPTLNIAQLVPSGFFLSTTMVFAAVRTHFPSKNTSTFMSIGILSRKKK